MGGDLLDCESEYILKCWEIVLHRMILIRM